MTSVLLFGETPSGAPVREVVISGGGLTARLIEYGCILRDLRLDGVDRPLTIGLSTLADYLADSEHIGAIAGRCANRLGGGRFVIDGVEHRATRNVGGVDTLHGGARGFGRRIWSLADHGPSHAAFMLESEDGEEGFPGALTATAVYRLTGDGTLELELTAEADAPTICNMTEHSYYNLSSDDRIDDHHLTVFADRITPLNAALIPTGEACFANSELDYRAERRIGDVAIDLNYVIGEAAFSSPAPAARLCAGHVWMEMATTSPGLQVYSGDNMPVGGADLGGRRRGPRCGLCLEPQMWPDAPNQLSFPSIELRPGEIWRRKTINRFGLL